jgi:LmbE family N-acetylglucosaminyl deacetylase
MKHLLSLTIILLSFTSLANKRTSEIYVDLLKLNSLNRVLYIAAHPDDENTRLLAYLSLGEKAETAYLSLTRGDGGQNLIGDELGYKLGVLRTQELLAARSHDKANQFFSRAVDFGYSKSATESFEKWGKEEILSDVVKVIREFKPDIIITRFPPDKRGGHGHHTASAMLAIEAFSKAADPDFLPEQVEKFGAWETTSLYWNTSYWWMKDIADSAAKYPDRYFSKDIGGYSPMLGMSYNEIGTIARSQHKCQGFGAILERGPRIEYFEHLEGKPIKKDFFENTPRKWSDVIDQDFEDKMSALVENFNFTQPDKNISALMSVLEILEKQKKTPFIEEKIELCENLIVNCLGLYMEVTAKDYSFVSGEELELNFYAVNRSTLPIKINGMKINGEDFGSLDATLKGHEELDEEISARIDANLSTPYWLVNDYKDLYVPN